MCVSLQPKTVQNEIKEANFCPGLSTLSVWTRRLQSCGAEHGWSETRGDEAEVILASAALPGCFAAVLPRLERVLERSMMVCLLGLLRTERLAKEMSAVTRVMDILEQSRAASR